MLSWSSSCDSVDLPEELNCPLGTAPMYCHTVLGAALTRAFMERQRVKELTDSVSILGERKKQTEEYSAIFSPRRR